MRFLKNKIQRAQQKLEGRQTEFPLSCSDPEDSSRVTLLNQTAFKEHKKVALIDTSPSNGNSSSKDKSLETQKKYSTRHRAPMKNIAINYGKAIANFAVSQLAVPYLCDKLDHEGATMAEFVSFVKKRKDNIGGISSFKPLLLIEEGDSRKLSGLKRVFKYIAEVFIKYFSVNWIIHGKVSHKMTYLKFRSKMLRRVQHPESFTYIKERTTRQ